MPDDRDYTLIPAVTGTGDIYKIIYLFIYNPLKQKGIKKIL